MSVTINVNNLSLCHRGSNGVSTATLPDLCKTPSPAGPVPIPYPNISMSSDLENGTSTVTADGGNMIAIKGSDFSRSTGDEPGTAGGVKSSVNMKESKWILYSFDVKMEGANACRLTDKMTQNGSNTVDAAGEFQEFLARAGGDVIKACAALLQRILDIIGEGVTGKTNGIRGLWERFKDNITGQGGPNDPPDRPPNPQQKLYPNGSNSWQRHDEEIARQQKSLEDHIDEYEQNCGGPTPQTQKAREWVTKKRPQPGDWTGPTPAPASPRDYTWLYVAGAAAVFAIGIVLAPVTGGGSAVAGTATAAVLLGVGLPGGSPGSPDSA